jgi:nucleoside-diphosphate-sugar epimerase
MEEVGMRILFIGGAKMTGPFAVRALLDAGHEVLLMHRSHSDSPLLHGATQMIGDKSELPAMRDRLAKLGLDVIVHMVAFTEGDAAAFVEAVAGVVPRAVVISSIDVYRAYGRLHRTEPGPPDPTPLDEDAPLRAKFSIHGAGYEKVAVEREARSDPRLPCTVLRYPAVYGPGDGQHRLFGWVRRMDDHRPFILVGIRQAGWGFTHGYVENVAAATVLAITNPIAVGRIYNVGDAVTPPWADWIRRVGSACGWGGKVAVIPDEQLPSHLSEDLDFSQDWVVDTRRIRNELGYAEYISPDDAMRRAVQWERQHGPVVDPAKFDYAAEDAAVAGCD